jgi:AcrR family transcriptional regulator
VKAIERLAADVVVEVVPRRPTPEERAAQRRDEIIDAAARVFAEKGYHVAGISDIAADLGIAHGTLYRYFKSKREIGERVLDRVLQRLAQTLLEEDPTASDTLEQFREQVVRMITGVFDLYERNPDHMRFFQHESTTIDADRIGAALDGFSEFVARFMVNGVQKGFLRSDLDIEVMSQSFVGVVFDVLRRMMRSPDAAALRDRWIAHGPTALLDGVAAR